MEGLENCLESSILEFYNVGYVGKVSEIMNLNSKAKSLRQDLEKWKNILKEG